MTEPEPNESQSGQHSYMDEITRGDDLELILPQGFPKEFADLIISFENKTNLSEAALPIMIAAFNYAMKIRDDRVCNLAIWGLRRFNTQVRPLMLEGLRDGTPSVQASCALFLDVSGDANDSIAALFECLLSQSSSVRNCAIMALWRVHPGNDTLHRSITAALGDVRYQQVKTPLEGVQIIKREEQRKIILEQNKQVLGWFRAIRSEEWETRLLEKLKVFWCIGRLDNEGLMTVGPAFGARKMSDELRKAQSAKLIPIELSLSFGESYIRKTLEHLASLFNAPPFCEETWTADESCPDLQVPRSNGKRTEVNWTPRGKAAWLLVDQFLAATQERPRFMHGD